MFGRLFGKKKMLKLTYENVYPIRVDECKTTMEEFDLNLPKNNLKQLKKYSHQIFQVSQL
jgi:hypothetical protein